jgi:hypothetical protein
MTIQELDHDEKVALVALIEAEAMTHFDLSDTEEEEVSRLATALGDEVYRDLLDEVESRFENITELTQFLKTITRQDARELIYGEVLLEAGAEPAFDPAESELLTWLAKEWNVKVSVEPEPEQA